VQQIRIGNQEWRGKKTIKNVSRFFWAAM